ncbi:MAG TPA: hypothetical protein VMQ83_04810 [Gammaproteobacteria bacterium]|nr:hypothetical protein [Gammaproteobacteria bacterium]
MNRLSLLLIAAFVVGCGGPSYRPVQEAPLERVISDACKRKGDRFSVDAQINSASRETVVLWDGYDGSRTIAVRLPSQGMGSKLRGVFGKSRYELALDRLNELRASGATVSFTMRCEGPGQAPMADRFSYFDQGQRVQFEF